MKTRSDAQLRTTAYHEAGHAVISASVRHSMERVTIVPDGDSAGACISPASLDERTEYGYRPNADATFLKELAVLMAGTIAGCLAKGQRPRWTAGGGVAGYSVVRVKGQKRRVRYSGGDLGQALDIVLHLVPEDEEEQARLQGRVWRLTVAEVRARWPQVRAVAEALLEKHTLSSRGLLKIIRESRGRTGPLTACLSAIARERRLSQEKGRRQRAREWRLTHPEEARQMLELASRLRRSATP